MALKSELEENLIIKSSDIGILDRIKTHTKITHRELAKESNTFENHLYSKVKRLRGRGFIRKQKSKDDARKTEYVFVKYPSPEDLALILETGITNEKKIIGDNSGRGDSMALTDFLTLHQKTFFQVLSFVKELTDQSPEIKTKYFEFLKFDLREESEGYNLVNSIMTMGLRGDLD